VLAALIQRTGAEGFVGLRAKISPGAWREAVESIVDDWLRLDYVDRLREDARSDVALATADDIPIPGDIQTITVPKQVTTTL
jgi:hypothetical protein